MPLQTSLLTPPETEAMPRAARVSWWRLGAALLVLTLSGSWFLNYTEPAPGRFQMALFFFMLVLILLEMAQAGWYLTRRAPIAGSSSGRRSKDAAPPLQMLGIVLLAGGLLGFLWGAVGQLLLSYELNLLAVSGGLLSMFVGALLAFNLTERK